MKLGIQICKLSACLHAISFSGFPSKSTSFFMRFDEEDHSCYKYVLIGEKSRKTTDNIIFNSSPSRNFATSQFLTMMFAIYLQYFDLSFFLYLMNLVSHVFELFFSAVSLCLRHLWVIECHLQWGFRNVAFFPTKNRLSKRGKKERVYIVRSIQSRKIHA